MASGATEARQARLLALTERALQHAAQSLSGLFGHTVRFVGLEVLPLAESALPPLANQSYDEKLAGVSFEITGEGAGRMLILLPLPTVSRIIHVLLNYPGEDVKTELERSAVREVGNILGSAFLTELGRQLGRRFMHSSPELVLTSAPRLVGEFLGRLRALDEEILVAQSVLQVPDPGIEGRLFIVPAVRSFEPITPGVISEEHV